LTGNELKAFNEICEMFSISQEERDAKINEMEKKIPEMGTVFATDEYKPYLIMLSEKMGKKIDLNNRQDASRVFFLSMVYAIDKMENFMALSDFIWGLIYALQYCDKPFHKEILHSWVNRIGIGKSLFYEMNDIAETICALRTRKEQIETGRGLTYQEAHSQIIELEKDIAVMYARVNEIITQK
jgi:hypothetical protein